jgi:archaemetzincin
MKRLQYNSSQILLQMIANPPPDAAKILGVVNVDLFIPILTFVFGEAQLRGIGSVVTLHRLNNKFYGLPEDKNLLNERLVKEAIHELGHNFGLVHCSNYECVMKSSTYVEDIDHKSSEMCDRCRGELKSL